MKYRWILLTLLSLGLGYGAVTKGSGIIAESYFGEVSDQGRTTSGWPSRLLAGF